MSSEKAVLGALDAGGGALPRLSMAPADPSFSLQRIHKGSLRLPAAGTCLFKELVRKKKDRDTYKGFSEYRKGELYELLHFQTNRLCQTSHSRIHGVQLIFRETLRGVKYTPYMAKY